jgi:hypothetical protein
VFRIYSETEFIRWLPPEKGSEEPRPVFRWHKPKLLGIVETAVQAQVIVEEYWKYYGWTTTVKW